LERIVFLRKRSVSFCSKHHRPELIAAIICNDIHSIMVNAWTQEWIVQRWIRIEAIITSRKCSPHISSQAKRRIRIVKHIEFMDLWTNLQQLGDSHANVHRSKQLAEESHSFIRIPESLLFFAEGSELPTQWLVISEANLRCADAFEYFRIVVEPTHKQCAIDMYQMISHPLHGFLDNILCNRGSSVTSNRAYLCQFRNQLEVRTSLQFQPIQERFSNCHELNLTESLWWTEPDEEGS
jgi:hypothetical protein